MIRPMVYEFPEDRICADESYDFMLGSHLLCATVYEKRARSRKVYLPRGSEWIDFYTGVRYTGEKTVILDAPLEHIPLLVRCGGIIPAGGEMKYVGEKADDRRDILLFPHRGSGSGSFTLIEDDGVSTDYQKGIVTELSFSMTSDEKAVALSFVKKGGYGLPYRSISVILPQGEERELTVNGKRYDTRKEPDARRSASVPV
ncbi:MAG: DUF5110 domain-containing protein [Spirochaetota bacterium]